MARISPLHTLHEQAGAVMRPYGPPDSPIPVVEVYTGVGREYAAIRKSAAIFDLPQRTTLAVSGADRLDFLNRMVTQELRGMAPWQVRRSFWLNRKGRIDADLNIANLAENIHLELDVHAAARTIEGLGAFIITEDVAIADLTGQTHRLAVHGPAAPSLLGRAALPLVGSAAIADLKPGQAGSYQIAREPCLIWRQDATGEIGLELKAPLGVVHEIYSLLAEEPGKLDRPDRGFDLHEAAKAGDKFRAVRAGWHAFNIARIEAGTPLYNIDFGPNSLPHETGVLNDRVSFKKGCYLGQEVVARMESLGHPKQRLVGLRVEGVGPEAEQQPVTGTPVLAADAADALVVGAVTSSAISPMLGSAAIAFGMVKHSHAGAGTKLYLQVGPSRLPAAVQESLAFWKRT